MLSKALIFTATYAVAFIAYKFFESRDFKRNPNKKARYDLLPMRYKWLCSFFVIPMFSASVIYGLLFVPAIVSYALLEAAVVKWYRKAKLL